MPLLFGRPSEEVISSHKSASHQCIFFRRNGNIKKQATKDVTLDRMNKAES
jgi:hypothetical protein